ncbi:sugar nucleotide-binding protein [Candidatus Pelagibacter sp.]|uniref:sugar nucleotide-binding protein n=1 Tax=Candidatus Pelagibacter sp. TaxID=2024849 RepID=UPI003F87D253|tara:strand:- start:522 stop:1241 length:720 start_codon:yes stop_codon:yes gene_type:complete
MKKIVFTGGSSRFVKVFRKLNNKDYLFFYPSRKKLNIENIKSIKQYFSKIKPDYLIHCAALSRPMNIHEKNIIKSIDTNIIGTSNVVKTCKLFNTKIIYFSTNYVYEGKKGNYKETDPVLPINKYAISKLGGECAVQLYENSLILRICMTEKPFIHKKAFKDVEMNFMFQEDLAKNLTKIIDEKGIINVGGKKQTVFNFAKTFNKKIKSISARKLFNKNYPTKQSMNVDKFKSCIKNIK